MLNFFLVYLFLKSFWFGPIFELFQNEDSYLDSNEFKLLCTSVYVGSTYKGSTLSDAKKHNVVFQIQAGADPR